MEKLLNSYDKEFMRMAMLKHEETFKEQVYELHRLYQIQKILMKNIENNWSNGWSQELWNSSKNGVIIKPANQHLNTQYQPSMKLDLELPADKFIPESNGDGIMLDIIDESEIELTLGPTNYSRRRKKLAETTRTSSNSRASFSSSSTGCSHINRTSNRASDVLTGAKLGLVQVPGSTIKNEQLLRQQERLEQQQSPWLLQVL